MNPKEERCVRRSSFSGGRRRKSLFFAARILGILVDTGHKIIYNTQVAYNFANYGGDSAADE